MPIHLNRKCYFKKTHSLNLQIWQCYIIVKNVICTLFTGVDIKVCTLGDGGLGFFSCYISVFETRMDKEEHSFQAGD